jgi:uncharacterized membrane protein (DUF4010 family)
MGLQEIYQLAIAVALGLMVGLQREGDQSPIAGIRTYPLITALGFLSGHLGIAFSPWFPAAGLLAVVAFMTLGNLALIHGGDPQPGMTSEFATVTMYAVGIALALEWTILAVAMAGIVLVLLQAKEPLQAFSARVGKADRDALARLVLLGLVILPAMPNRSFGPLGVLNPYQIWLMVVFIVGISLAAYVIYRLVGGGGGTILVGILGGLISSTASTITFSRMTVKRPSLLPGAAVMVLIASTVVFARVVVELAVVSWSSLPAMAPPLLSMMGVMILVSAVVYRWAGEGLSAPPPEEPPSDLRSAVAFGLLYAAVLVAVAFSREYLGDRGLFVVSFVSGLTDMDAITLSSARLVEAGELAPDTGWRMILVGGMSNLVFKAGIVAVVGTRRLLRPVLLGFGASILGGVAILFLWP